MPWPAYLETATTVFPPAATGQPRTAWELREPEHGTYSADPRTTDYEGDDFKLAHDCAGWAARLAERTEAPWTFEVSLKPGIHALIATVQQADQPKRTSRPHTIVVGE